LGRHNSVSTATKIINTVTPRSPIAGKTYIPASVFVSPTSLQCDTKTRCGEEDNTFKEVARRPLERVELPSRQESPLIFPRMINPSIMALSPSTSPSNYKKRRDGWYDMIKL